MKRGTKLAYKLVIVDDENRIRKGMIYSFSWEQMGFQVIADFESSLQALEYIIQNPVDVLLTDIKIPIMDGLELVKKVKENFPLLECILISGYRDFEYAKSALSLGVREYIMKPFNREEVLAVFQKIRNELDHHNDNHESEKKPPLYYDKIVDTVKNYVEKNLPCATLDGAAIEAELSAGYLSKLFKHHAEMSFSDYLLACKMKRAKTLLADTRMKGYEISELVGYDNPKNFSRSFKQYYGISPREYREKGFIEL